MDTMGKECKQWAAFLLTIFICLLLTGCGADGSKSVTQSPVVPETPGSGETPGQTESPAVAYLAIGASSLSLKTDGNDSTEISVTALDEKRVPLASIPVSFSTTGGQISASSVQTDTSGKASITFSTGLFEKTNQVVTVTAGTTNGKQASIPIKIGGSKLEMSLSSTTLQIGEEQSVTLTVKDGSDAPVYKTEVVLEGKGILFSSVSGWDFATQPEATESGSLKGSIFSDINGEVRFTVKGGASAVKGFLYALALGAEAKRDIEVVAAQSSLRITSPAGENITKNIQANGLVSEIEVVTPYGNPVDFYTSLGTWEALSPAGLANRTVAPDGNGAAKLSLYSQNAGVATITVFTKDGEAKERSHSVRIAMVSSADRAHTVELQASQDRIPPSVGVDLKNTATLYAKVKDDKGGVVAGAPVWFSLKDTTGGGEYIDPAVVYTNSAGEAQATFFAGSLVSSANGVGCVASVLKNNGTPSTAEQRVVISGEASSVSIARALLAKEHEDTAYDMPMSVLVTDAKGNPVKGQTVYLSVWPKEYYIDGLDPDGKVISIGSYPNEDVNRNGILDPGEDAGGNPAHGNGQLDPAASTAGTVPFSVVTDEHGLAQFSYIYQKMYAVWLGVEVSASTKVYGTETMSALSFVLPILEKDAKYMPPSPFRN